MNNRNWLKYLIVSVVMAGISVLLMVSYDLFSQTELTEIMKILSDSFVVPGILLLCLGLLVVSTNGGTFDMISYGFKSLFSVFKKDPTKRKHRTFYEYRQEKAGNKRSFWYMLIIGGIFTIIGVVFLILFNVYAI